MVRTRPGPSSLRLHGGRSGDALRKLRDVTSMKNTGLCLIGFSPGLSVSIVSGFNMPTDNLTDLIDLGKLPSGPRVLSRLIYLVRQPGVQLSAVADLFVADPALTARVVAACNTPFYSRGEPTGDIRDAVLRLGLNEVSRIVQIVALTDLRKYPTHLYTQTSAHFWERSLHTAFAMDEISGCAASAYTAGMMHLVGIWVLCSVFPGGHLAIAERELALQARLEQLRLGVCFAEAGAVALAKWGFAPAVCRAVDRQLTPSLADDPEHRELARLLSRAIALADWHYGAKNEQTLLRSDLTITDVEDCNARAAAQVARIGVGF
jgi:HD-like signal output (HDOD) protein